MAVCVVVAIVRSCDRDSDADVDAKDDRRERGHYPVGDGVGVAAAGPAGEGAEGRGDDEECPGAAEVVEAVWCWFAHVFRVAQVMCWCWVGVVHSFGSTRIDTRVA